MTQAELAQRLDVTDKAVSKWERGKSWPDISLFNRLAAELRVSVIEILSGEILDAACSSNLTGKLRREEVDSASFPAAFDAGDLMVSPYLFEAI